MNRWKYEMSSKTWIKAKIRTTIVIHTKAFQFFRVLSCILCKLHVYNNEQKNWIVNASFSLGKVLLKLLDIFKRCLSFSFSSL